MAREKGDENLLIRFYRQRQESPAKSKTAGRPIFEDFEVIDINIPGSRDFHSAIVTDEHRSRFKDEYAAWKKSEGAPLDGFPLDEWPAASKSFAEEMKMVGVRTVEELAALSDQMAAQISANAITMRARAQAYLDGAKPEQELAQAKVANASLVDENAALKAKLSDLMNLVPKSKQDQAAQIVDPASLSDEELEKMTNPQT